MKEVIWNIVGVLFAIWIGGIVPYGITVDSFLDGLIWPLIVFIKLLKRLREEWDR